MPGMTLTLLDDLTAVYQPAAGLRRRAELRPNGEAGPTQPGLGQVERSLPGLRNPQAADGLDESERRRLEQMKATDRQVRAHEQAHLAAAGNLARSGAKFSYETGPDGARYAVGGEVDIDTSPVEGDPRATLAKAARIQRAALAPADPSPQDRSIAAEAAAMAIRAQQELTRQAAQGGESTRTWRG